MRRDFHQYVWWFDEDGIGPPTPAEENAMHDLHLLMIGAAAYSSHVSRAEEPGKDGSSWSYPSSVDDLILDFRIMLTWTSNGPVEALDWPLGWTSLSANQYTYLKQYNELGQVVGFMFIGYGSDNTQGYDIDGDGEADGVVSLQSNGTVDWSGRQQFWAHGREVTIDFTNIPAP